jgi:hypothetical protein
MSYTAKAKNAQAQNKTRPEPLTDEQRWKWLDVLFTDTTLSRAKLALGVRLWQLSLKEGKAFASEQTLATKIGSEHRNTVSRIIKEMEEERGVIYVESGGRNKINNYYLIPPDTT